MPQPTASSSWVSGLIPRENDPAKVVGDGSLTSLIGIAVNWFWRTFPEAALTVYGDEQGERVPIRPHDLTDLYAEPNPFYDGDTLWAGCLWSDLIDGNSYQIKARQGAGRVAEMYWMPHSFIEPKGGDRADSPLIEYYELTVAGKRWQLDVRDVVHLRHGIDPRNPRKGLSQLKGQLRELMTDEQAARFSASLLGNFAVPGLIISPKNDEATIDKPDADAMKAQIGQDFGAGNVGKTAVTSGAVDVHTLSFSPEQMSVRDIRGIPEERISAAIGVAAAVLGLGTGLAQTKVGATMRELREMATEQTLVPMWTRFGKQAGRQMIYEFSGSRRDLSLSFDTTEVRVLQEDRNQMYERETLALTAGGISVATYQRRLGYEADESQDVYLRSALTVAVPAGTPPPEPLQSASRNGQRNGRKAEVKLTDSQRHALSFVRFLDRAFPPIESSFAASLDVAFSGLGRRAAEVYLQLPKAIKSAAKSPTPDDERIVNEISQAVDAAAYRASTIGPAYQAAYRQALEIVVNGVQEAFDIGISIGERDLIAERVLAEGGRQLGLLDLTAQTREAVYQALADAREELLSIADTAKRIEELVGAGPYRNAGARYRAETIARTETRHAMNRAVAETGKAAGFTVYVAFDNRTGFDDDECSVRDGQEFTYDEMISESDHPRGTLSWSPVPGSQAAEVTA